MKTHLGRAELAAQTEDEEDMMVVQEVVRDEPWFESRVAVLYYVMSPAQS